MVTGATGRSSALSGLATIGGRVEAEYAEVVQAYVPVGALRKLADLAAVSYVGVPAVPLADSTTDEVVVASNAGTWQAAGISGAGVKVGIIDLGFIGYTVAQTNGDLPPSVTTADFGCGGVATGTSHGTAVAEIVYKMAPSAQLYLICIATNINLGQAKDYTLAQGITIVNHSVGWFNTSRGDGTGGPSSPDAIVSSARAGGILWINAAGNAAQYHWSGTFVDANANGYHDFAPGSELDTFVVGSGATVCAWLKWDSWPTTAQDFDLYLFQLSPLTRVKSSTNAQTGTQPPTEQLCYANSGPTQSFGLAIWRFSATATPRFDLFISNAGVGSLTYQVAAGSVTEPASSVNAMAVGAICFSTNALEPYSSQGPTIDGRLKPDIAGQDSASSPVYGVGGCAGSGGTGSGGFTGTSASSPHVAGAAALVAQANPTFTPAQIQSFLEARAFDLGPTGKDNLYGSGQLWLGAPPTLVPIISGLSPNTGPTAGGTSVTVTGTGFATATGATSVRFGTNAATGVSCASATTCSATSPAGSGTVDVTVTVAGLTSPTSAADQFTYLGASVGPGTYEDTNAAITFSGTWTSWPDASNSGGSAKYSNQTGASASLVFTGSALTLTYVKQGNVGIATVAIDGLTVDSLDSYSPTRLFQQQKTYTTTSGVHTVTVTVSGTKNAASSDVYLIFDNFIVGP
jgi:subtilisin family serine protease